MKNVIKEPKLKFDKTNHEIMEIMKNQKKSHLQNSRREKLSNYLNRKKDTQKQNRRS